MNQSVNYTPWVRDGFIASSWCLILGKKERGICNVDAKESPRQLNVKRLDKELIEAQSKDVHFLKDKQIKDSPNLGCT